MENPPRKPPKRAAVTTLVGDQASVLTSQPSPFPQPSLAGDFDHLLRWQQNEPEDEIVEWDKEGWGQDEEDEEDESLNPIEDAESPAEESGDLDAEEAAIRNARQQPQGRSRKVPLDDVIKIINESMETYAEQWTPGKNLGLGKKKREHDFNPIRLWEEAHQLGRREEYIEKYRSHIQYFENSLDVLSEEICGQTKSDEADIRTQCKCLEVHVHNREEAKWRLSIYELPPVESEEASDTEQQNVPQRPPRASGGDVVDLGSGTDSSQNSLHEEMIVDVEEPLTQQVSNHTSNSSISVNTPSAAPNANDSNSNQVVLHSCSWPNCTEQFKQKEHLKRHLTNHADARSYQCTECRFKAKLKHKLQYHLESEHGWSRAAAGMATDVAGLTSTQGDTRMIMDDSPTVKKTKPPSELEIVPSIEPGVASVSPVLRSPGSPRAQKQKPQASSPETASILAISRWNMNDLVVAKDRKRIIMKVMLDMSDQDREMIRTRTRAVKKANLLREISTCIDMLYRKEEKMPGVLPKDLPKVKLITRFFLCWWLADDYMHRMPTEQQLDKLATNLHHCDDLATIYDYVHFIIHNKFTEEAGSSKEVIVISDDDDIPAKLPSRKKPANQPAQVQAAPQDDIIMLD